MKKFTLAFALIVMAFCSIAFGGCFLASSDNNSSDGDDAESANTQYIKNLISTTPVKDGYIFGGWYSDSSLKNLVTKSSNLKGVTEVYPKWLTVPEPITIDVRKDAVTITDAGRAKQQCDKVMLSDYYDVVGLNYAGYTKLRVTFSFDVKEIDDGYEYVFFYYNSSCQGNGVLDKIENFIGLDKDDPSLLYTYKFEHTPGKADTSWKNYTFTTTLNMGSLKDDLYVRYGASGRDDDDWLNKNVVISFEAIK